MGRTKIIRLIDSIRNSFVNSVDVFTKGRCYQFALIIRSQFKGEIWYSEDEGHIYFKYQDKFYDIRGLHLVPPKDIELFNHKQGHRPHRWKSNNKGEINGA